MWLARKSLVKRMIFNGNVIYREFSSQPHMRTAESKFYTSEPFCFSVLIPALWLYYLVGGLEHDFIFPYIGNNHPNWLSYFSEG
jgi:hypothetical protein